MFEVIEQQIVDINEAIGKNNFSKALELIDLASDEILRVQPAQKDNDLMPAKIAYLQARQTLIAERGKYFNSAAIATAETALNLARTKLPFDISNSFDGLPEKEIQSCIDQLESDLANAQKINSLEEQLERFFLNLFSLSASPEQWPVLKQAVLNRLLNSLNLSSVTEEVKVREVLESRIKEENFNFYLRYIVKEAKLHTWFHDAENPERILTVIQLGSTEGYDGANVNYHSLLKLRDMLSSKTVGYFSEDYNDYNQKGKTHFQAKLYGLLLAKLGLTTRAQEYFSAIFDLAIERKDLCFIGTFLDENLVTEYGMPARTKGNFTNRLKTAIEEEFNRTIQAKEFNNAVALFLEVSQTTRGEIVYRHNFTEQEVNTLRERLISGYLEYLFSSDHEKFKATEVLSLLVGRTSSETIISNRGNKYAQVPLHETNQKDKPKITFEVTAKCVTEGVRKALYKYSTEEVITDEIPSKENNKQPEKKPLLTEQQKHNEAE
ncbi:MAG: hypothetical protein JSS53_03655, partial [Proteobacteria bacterium]|nr:hypothetical protein [Pseudomonadota bacterium]